MRQMRLGPCVARLVASSSLLFGICLAFSSAHAEDMRFSLVSSGSSSPAVMTATGEITDQTPYEFLNFIRGNLGRHVHAVIFLDSPGGKVVAAMDLGRIWRQIGATAIVARAEHSDGSLVPGECQSACVYALIGAKRRVIPQGAIIGVHRMFFYDDDSGLGGEGASGQRHYDNGWMKALLSHYASRMGVSPALISEAERISSARIHVLSRAEIARYRLGSARR
jgi:hypothetical protein